MPELSLDQARRIAISAQGLAAPRPPGRRDAGHVTRTVRQLGALQIDSVNVVARAHELTLHARLGDYPRAALDRAAYARGELIEYWAHEASYVPVELQPLLRWRMHRFEHESWWQRLSQLAAEKPGYVDAVLEELADRGPLAASELSEPGDRAGPWWGWAEGKVALEWLFAIGRTTVVGRRNFERRYDLVERAIPSAVLDAPTPPIEDAHRELLAIAGRAHGVGTVRDLADYFRIKPAEATPRVAELAEAGVLRPVRVAGWRDPAYLAVGARLPRRVAARALLCPFDSLIWDRRRTERLFGFHYRIEIYVPEPKRVFGYYVLPFLLGDRLVARIDLKADRPSSTLLVRGAFGEPEIRHGEVAEELALSLHDMAAWLGLDRVAVSGRGDLVRSLRLALR